MATVTKNAITLKGSAKIIAEYLKFGINSILFQRGIYPGENFESVNQYGITLLMSKDSKIQEYLDTVLNQLQAWLEKQEVDQISMVIKNVSTMETIECWDFNIRADIPTAEGEVSPISSKELKTIQGEIRDVMRQIAATVSYLPLLECICSFDVLVHTKCAEICEGWHETKAAQIENAQIVQLKSFSTGLQTVDTVVNYKLTD